MSFPSGDREERAHGAARQARAATAPESLSGNRFLGDIVIAQGRALNPMQYLAEPAREDGGLDPARWGQVVERLGIQQLVFVSLLLERRASARPTITTRRAFLQAMAQLNWIIGRNIRVDIHWATADATNIPKHAAELAALVTRAVVQATLSKECWWGSSFFWSLGG